MILSIGLIVKNEEKILRKCLDSLKPVMDAVDSELIIVDTGSADDTVRIVKEYTDNIYSFVWCKDFSAARNVSIENAHGEWFMFIDADESFGDATDLIDFFCSGEYKKFNSATYIQRNYTVLNMSSYSDFSAPRLTKLLPETKFINPIHEKFNTFNYPLKTLSSYVDHFGYANDNKDMLKEKANRNIELLLPLLEKNPDECMIYLQLAESSFALDFDTAIDYCDKGIEVSTRLNDDVQYALYCKKAVAFSSKKRHTEVLDVVDKYFKARNMKTYIGTDIEIFAMKGASNSALNNYPETIEAFKIYADLYKEFQRGGLHTDDTFMYSMNFTSELNYRNAMLSLINACLSEKKYNTASINSKNIPVNKYINDRNFTEVRICQEFNIMKGLDDYSGVAGIIKQADVSYVDYVHAIIRNKCAEPNARDKILTVLDKAKQIPDDAFTGIIRLNYELYCKKALTADMTEKYIDDTEFIPTDCADIIYMVLKLGMPVDKLSKKITYDNIGLYIPNCITLCSDFADVLISYAEKAAVCDDIHSVHWLYRLYRLVVLSENLENSADIENLFVKYSELAYKYVNSVFRDEVLYGDRINVIPAEFRAVYYCKKASESLENGDKANYLSCLKNAVHADPTLKNCIKTLGSKVKQEVSKQQTKMSEFELLALKIKKNIIQLIENGRTDEAKATLASYEQINPKDTDIVIFKKKLEG